MENLGEAIRDRRSSPKLVQSKLTEPSVVKSVVQSVTQSSSLLTTGEAYEILKTKGFDRSQGTLRRWLADAIQSGELPEVLVQFGLLADFEKRRNANPKDNSVRWLYFS